MFINRLRWAVVSLIALATVINYIDRSALAVMWPSIASDLGLDKSDYANIMTVFMVSYAIGQGVFGGLFDKLGARIGFTISIGAWSIATILHGIATTVTSFSIFRFLLGFSEAGNWPGATKVNAEWFPVKERALAQGIFNAGASIGSIIAPPLIAALYAFIGWQATFFVIGGVGLFWLIPWLYLYKGTPSQHPMLAEAERQYILSGQKQNNADSDAEEYVPTYREMLGHKQAWSVVSARLFIDPVWWLFVAWLPLYLNERFGFDVKQIGAFSWVPYVGAMFGALLGGWISGRLIGSGWSVNRARKTVIGAGCLIMLPALLATIYAETPTMAVTLIAFILFGFQVVIGNIQTLPSDYFSGKTVGSLAGLSGASAVLSVIVVTQLVPVLSANGNYSVVFGLAATFVPLCFISVLFGGKIKAVVAKR
ncbi:MFS transporter [Catenovulum maritimum]|uniref:MFS transporter n=1 Tax=Catenovulum maritimum TaxID=1513271 RepID=A0A0J8H113_9ALTE|nr:MFS transporter [Catenovulum maritimum]KMT66708.1 MFS transporter [Catenovulum maritimum]